MIKYALYFAKAIILILFLINAPIILKLAYWKFKDFVTFVISVKNKTVKTHLFGIKMYVGLYGMGKTMALTHELETLRKKYGDKILISTNYFYEGEDFPIGHWKDLLKIYDKPIIFAYDEIQNDFNSRDYANFPTSLLTLLTQNRKGYGKRILCTAQRFKRVDKIFRELCQSVYVCKTRFGRLTSVKEYDVEDYEQMIAEVEVNRKMKVKKISRKTFVQTDYIREQYDSYQTLESAKEKEYMDRSEIINLI